MTGSEDEHWSGLAQLVASAMKRRISSLGDAASKRPKLIELFAHKIEFERRYINEIGKKGTKAEVLSSLKRFGSPQDRWKIAHGQIQN